MFKRVLLILVGECPNCQTGEYWEFHSMSFWRGKKYKCSKCGSFAYLTDSTGPP